MPVGSQYTTTSSSSCSSSLSVQVQVQVEDFKFKFLSESDSECGLGVNCQWYQIFNLKFNFKLQLEVAFVCVEQFKPEGAATRSENSSWIASVHLQPYHVGVKI